jgi:hypothetical protein
MSTFSAHLKMVTVAALVAAVLALITPPWAPAMAEYRSDRSPVINVPNSDPEMAAAIAKARATLPAFWASYEAPKATEEGHSLKVRFATRKNDGEHIWMAEVKKLPTAAIPHASPISRAICRASASVIWSNLAKPTSPTGCSCATARSSAARPSGRS